MRKIAALLLILALVGCAAKGQQQKADYPAYNEGEKSAAAQWSEKNMSNRGSGAGDVLGFAAWFGLGVVGGELAGEDYGIKD
jgi:hypothetical protein